MMKNLVSVLIAVIVKTGEIFPATFPDRGPDQALRSARHFTGTEEVGVLLIDLLLYVHGKQKRSCYPYHNFPGQANPKWPISTQCTSFCQ